jgi:hypothetical protein
MKLIENEKALIRGAGNQLTLTNYRVIKYVVSGSTKNVSSIFLNQISSIHFRSINNVLLLALSIVCPGIGALLQYGVYPQESSGVIFVGSGVSVGVLMLLEYFRTKRQIIEFIGNGGEKISAVAKDGFDKGYQFILAVEQVSKTGEFKHQITVLTKVNGGVSANKQSVAEPVKTVAFNIDQNTPKSDKKAA